MRINTLRGSVADRPIDSRVVEEAPGPGTLMEKIVGVRPEVERVDVSRRPDYDKG